MLHEISVMINIEQNSHHPSEIYSEKNHIFFFSANSCYFYIEKNVVGNKLLEYHCLIYHTYLLTIETSFHS